MLWLNDTHGFYFSGFLGIIVLILYFIFIYINIKKHYFKFSILVLLLYLILVFYMVLRFNNGITYAMRAWWQPFLLCIIVDGIGYSLKRRKK